MRAHMALKKSGIKIELREVKLSDMPEQALNISPNATVPILLLPDGTVMNESWDIVKWALQQHDPDNWLGDDNAYLTVAEMLIETNDFSFKNDLDHYKYSDRHPEHSEQHYREACEEFIVELEEMLSENKYLFGSELSLADIGVFPFIRQFSLVNKDWFDESHYEKVKQWLDGLINSALFQNVFQKHDIWKSGDTMVHI
jgi:glutathione S-transferase